MVKSAERSEVPTCRDGFKKGNMLMRYGQNRRAFTIIELLTVVAIISVLIAVLTVGGNKIRKLGKNLQQKAVFHGMTVGLELFSSDFNGYPASRLTANNGAAPYVTGAQHLAEALLGRDERGFEPMTGWYAPNDKLYRPNVPADLYDTQVANSQSLARRKGPYCELKYGYAVSIYALWGTKKAASKIYDSGANPTGAKRSPVITDVFNKVEVKLPNGEIVRAGMPILYFKANPGSRFRVDAARQEVKNPAPAEYTQWVYNYNDNLPALQLPWLSDTVASEAAKKEITSHYYDPGNASNKAEQNFYETITQPGGDAARGFFKPYNGETFLLISAGYDGIFGTKDDIVNFD